MATYLVEQKPIVGKRQQGLKIKQMWTSFLWDVKRKGKEDQIDKRNQEKKTTCIYIKQENPLKHVYDCTQGRHDVKDKENNSNNISSIS